jgi:hypothetical protein
VSAQHRKPVVAFVLLACLAVAIVGVRAAEGSKGRFIAAPVGVAAEVHGTIPGQSEADRRSAAERVEALGPAFAALNGDAATVTILSDAGAAVSTTAGPRPTSLARGTGTASRDSAPRDSAPLDGTTRDQTTRDQTRRDQTRRDQTTRDRARGEARERRRSAPDVTPVPGRSTAKHPSTPRTSSHGATTKHRPAGRQRVTASGPAGGLRVTTYSSRGGDPAPRGRGAKAGRGVRHGGDHGRAHVRDRGRDRGDAQHGRGKAGGRGHGHGHRSGR